MKRTLALLIAAGLTLSACAAANGGEESAGPEIGVTAEPASMPTDQASLATGAGSDGGSVALDVEVTDGRQVVRQASLELRADDTRAAYEHVIDLVESTGGFLADANVFPPAKEGDQPQISMTVRIPADELNATMAAIEDSVDEVVSETQTARDVTAEYVDLEARLTNLKALEVELRALLEEVRKQENADPEKLLRVFNEISDTRGQIEQIQGQINYLSDLTALASVQIGITQSPATVPIVDEPWSPAEAAKEAMRQLVDGLQGVADTAIGFALYALPMLLIIVGPLALMALFAYRRWFRRTEPSPTG